MPAPVNRHAFVNLDGWGGLFDWMLPTRCMLCGERGQENQDLCQDCAVQLPWNKAACQRCAMPLPALNGVSAVCGPCLKSASPVAQSHATFLYRSPLDQLVPRFKFRNDLASGRLLAESMAKTCRSHDRPDALIAIPLHASRLRARGYDQALELAKPLARALCIPLLRHVLIRQRATMPQSRLDATQRRRNLRDAFSLGAKAVVPPHVALIDDVMTTGATLHAAAKVLRRAGVRRVDAWVCARVV